MSKKAKTHFKSVMHIRFLLVLASFFSFLAVGTCGQLGGPFPYRLKEAVLKTAPPYANSGSAMDFRGAYLSCGESPLLLVTLKDVTGQRSSFRFYLLLNEEKNLRECEKFDVYVVASWGEKPAVRIIGRGKDGKILLDTLLEAEYIEIITDDRPKEKPSPKTPRDPDEAEKDYV